MRSVFLVLIVLATAAASWSPPLPAALLHPAHSPGSAMRYRRERASWPAAPAPPAHNTHVFSPIDFGGDPSGTTDSTAALNAALGALLNSSSGVRDARWILDCGGATLDLAGGQYLVSGPLSIPAYVGNLRVVQGTLRASPSFPRDRYLIETGLGGHDDGNNIDIFFEALFLDGSQIAAGCLLVKGLFGGVIGPQVYVFNFTDYGIRVSSGHEVTVRSC